MADASAIALFLESGPYWKEELEALLIIFIFNIGGRA